MAEASRRVAVAGGAVHRRVGVPGDGGRGGAGERGVAAVAPGRRAGERRAGDATSSGPSRSSRRACPRRRRPCRWRGSCRWRPGSGPWHSVQARPAERSVGVRWRRCAPTPREVVSALPEASTAVALKPGAEVALVLATAAPAWPESTPWQAVQPLAGFWMVPSTCVAAVTVVAVVPVWQLPQAVLAGWCVAIAGGAPWQAVQPSLPEVAQGDRRRRSGCRPGSCRGSRCSSRCAPPGCRRSGTAPPAIADAGVGHADRIRPPCDVAARHDVAVRAGERVRQRRAPCALVHVRQVHAGDAGRRVAMTEAQRGRCRLRPGDVTRAGVAVAGGAARGREHRDGPVDVGGERRRR